MKWITAPLVAVLALGACSGSEHPSAHRPAVPTLRGTWQPRDIAGYSGPLTRPVWPMPPNLTFVRTAWSGSDGCNVLAGGFGVGRRGRFQAKAQGQHQVGCNNVPNVEVLTHAVRVRIVHRNMLVFFDARGAVLGRYARDTSPKAACAANGFPPTEVRLQLVGGLNGQPRPLPGTVTATASTDRICTVAIGTSGAARLSLRPGTYTMTGHSPLFGSNAYECRADRQVVFTRPDPKSAIAIPLGSVLVSCPAR